MTRKLLDDWRVAKRELAAPSVGASVGPLAVNASNEHLRVAIVTSTMAEPVIERMARDIRKATGREVRVVPVVNKFFGPLVTVAGLLCAQDVLDTLAERCSDFGPGDLLLLPRVMLDNAGKRFLDDITLDEFRSRLAARVVFAKTAAEIVAAIREHGASADCSTEAPAVIAGI
jgi:NifB/MoaA-like Fe-S oxidoreductase